MRQRGLIALVTVGVCVVFTSGVLGQGRGKPSPPPPVPVVVTVHDWDASSAPFSLQSDGIDSGVYGNADGIIAEIAPDGDWELNLNAQTARTVRLSFDPIGASPQGPTGFYNARVLTRCFDEQGNNSGLLQIAEGDSNTRCSLRVVFTVNGVRHILVMSPMYAGTSWVTASCPADGDANNTCEQWTIAHGSASAPGVASLFAIAKNNKEVLVGTYYVSFRIDIRRE